MDFSLQKNERKVLQVKSIGIQTATTINAQNRRASAVCISHPVPHPARFRARGLFRAALIPKVAAHLGDPMADAERISSVVKSGSPEIWKGPMNYLVGYIAVLLSFGAIDSLWLRWMGPLLYRPTLGDILLAEVRLAPAVAFYLVYPIGLLVFAVLPAVKSNSVVDAAVSGLVFGAIAYATYDLTNFATLRNWTLELTVLDVAYGGLVSGLAAIAGVLAVGAVSTR